MGNPQISGRRRSAVAGVLDADAAVPAGVVIAEFAAPVSRAIVNEQQLDMFITLADCTFYARGQVPLAVVDGDNDAYQAGYQCAVSHEEFLSRMGLASTGCLKAASSSGRSFVADFAEVLLGNYTESGGRRRSGTGADPPDCHRIAIARFLAG